MAQKDKGPNAKDVVKGELGETGCVVTVSTEKQGENLVGKLEITEAANDNQILKVVAVGKPMDISFSFGLSCSQNDLMVLIKDFIVSSDFLKLMVPTMGFEEIE